MILFENREEQKIPERDDDFSMVKHIEVPFKDNSIPIFHTARYNLLSRFFFQICC